MSFSIQRDAIVLRLTSHHRSREVFAGVLDFTADEGTYADVNTELFHQTSRNNTCSLDCSLSHSIVLPEWMHKRLGLGPGAVVEVSQVTLMKAESCSLRPQSTDFHKLRDHR